MIAGSTLKYNNRWTKLAEHCDAFKGWVKTIIVAGEIDLLTKDWIDYDCLNKRIKFDNCHFDWHTLRDREYRNYKGVINWRGCNEKLSCCWGFIPKL